MTLLCFAEALAIARSHHAAMLAGTISNDSFCKELDRTWALLEYRLWPIAKSNCLSLDEATGWLRDIEHAMELRLFPSKADDFIKVVAAYTEPSRHTPGLEYLKRLRSWGLRANTVKLFREHYLRKLLPHHVEIESRNSPETVLVKEWINRRNLRRRRDYHWFDLRNGRIVVMFSDPHTAFEFKLNWR